MTEMCLGTHKTPRSSGTVAAVFDAGSVSTITGGSDSSLQPRGGDAAVPAPGAQAESRGLQVIWVRWVMFLPPPASSSNSSRNSRRFKSNESQYETLENQKHTQNLEKAPVFRWLIWQAFSWVSHMFIFLVYARASWEAGVQRQGEAHSLLPREYAAGWDCRPTSVPPGHLLGEVRVIRV